MARDPLEELALLRDHADAPAQWRPDPHVGVASGANSTLRQELDDDTGYPGGRWPPATTSQPDRAAA